MNKKSICAALALVFLVWAMPSFADKPVQSESTWAISLDAGGHIVRLEDRGQRFPALHEPLEHAIRTWAFEPGRLNGQPAPTETSLTVLVSLEPLLDDKYAIRIVDARTGGVLDNDSIRKAPPPPPARAMLRHGHVTRVVMKADYDANGKIVAVQPQLDQNINAPDSFVAAIVAAAQKWSVAPERVGGHGIASSMMLPICIVTSPIYRKSMRRADQAASAEGANDACTWTPPGSRSNIENGGSYALAPVVALKSDVIGHVL